MVFRISKLWEKVKQKELYKLSLDAIDKAKQEVKTKNILFLK